MLDRLHIRRPNFQPIGTRRWQLAKNVVLGTRILRKSPSYREIRDFLDKKEFQPAQHRIHEPLFKSKQVEIGCLLGEKGICCYSQT
jgi:hypothetical protein